ncbi:MAG: kelch repeat-containing protein [Patescibacteria group bacterium]
MPRHTITQFTGVKDNGYYWLLGLTPRRDAGKSFLIQRPKLVKIKKTGETSVTNLSLIQGFTISDVSGSAKVYAIDKAGYVYDAIRGTLSSFAQLKDLTDVASNYPDITEDPDGDLMVTTARYLVLWTGSAWTETTHDFGAEQANYVRQIIKVDDYRYIGNGNYLASWDGTTFTAQAKQLPEGYLFACGSYHNDYMAIGCNLNGKGMVVFWDSYSPGFQNQIYLEDEIKAIYPYKGGWLAIASEKLLYITLSSYEEISRIPDYGFASVMDINHNGMVVVGEDVFINGGLNMYTRGKTGVWRFNMPTRSWSFIPYDDGGLRLLYNTSAGAIYYDIGTMRSLYVGYAGKPSASTLYYVGTLRDINNTYAEVVLPIIEFSNKTKISKIWLNLAEHLYHTDCATPNISVVAKIADAREFVWGYALTNNAASASNKIKIDGTISTYRGAVGDEVLVLEGQNAGLTAHISSIANEGTNTEEWTLDTSLNGNTESGVLVNVLPFKKLDVRTISANPYSQLMFDAKRIESTHFLIKFIITATAGTIQINSVEFEYEQSSNR